MSDVVNAEIVRDSVRCGIDIDLGDLMIAIQCMELVEKNCKNAQAVTETLAKFRALSK